jgi:iron complex outermembrane receptor protein
MSMTRGKMRSALLLTSALGLLPGIALAAEDNATVENIVVTAQKREENLQVVPVAVTALSTQALQTMRYESLSNLSAAAPGLSVRVSAGGNAAPNFTIRGVYGSGTFASDPGVSMYVDGVYLSETNGSDFDLADVERIEVLRGPQGTLFGRNAIGGAVNVITKEPTGKFEGRQEIGGGNLGQFRAKTSLNLPAWGALSASINYLHDEQDGDIRNLGAGTVWHYGVPTGGKYGDFVSPKTLGGHDTNAVGATLKLDVDGMKAVYRFNYSHKDYTPPGTAIASFAGDLFGLGAGFWAFQNPAIRTPVTTTRPDAVNNWYSAPALLTTQSHSLNITIPIDDHFTVKNLLALRKVNDYAAYQLDGFGGVLLSPTVPLMALTNATQSNQHSWQEELQLNADFSFVTSTVGFLHYHSHTIEGGFPNIVNANFAGGLGTPFSTPAYTDFTPPVIPGILDNDVYITSNAVYTQNEIHILPKLDLVLGGRWTHDKRGGLDNSPTPASPGVSINYTKSEPTYLLGLNYKLTDDIFTYAKMSTAYISGGRLANVPFNPATAKSYEIGVKSDLLDHKARINLAGYTVKYTGLQTLTNPTGGCASKPGVSLFASQCIINGGDAKADGIEAEATLVPVAGLTLSGNLAYTHMRYTKVDPTLRNPQDGSFVSIFTPAWTGQLSASYEGPDMDSMRGAHFFGRLDGNYQSSAWSAPSSAFTSTLAFLKTVQVPAHWIVNGRAGLGGFQAGDTNVEIAGYVKNLFDDKSLVYGFNGTTDFPASYEPARTYGVELTIGF